jgi:hypothetical protein
MTRDDGWPNAATREVADQVRADPVLLVELLDRINSLPGGLSFEQLTKAAGAEVLGVWACRSDEPPVVADVDWQSLGESFAMQLLGNGIERDL